MRDLAKSFDHVLITHSAVREWARVGTGLGDHVHHDKGNSSVSGEHAERIAN